MKPKPFSALNHLTVPVAIAIPSLPGRLRTSFIRRPPVYCRQRELLRRNAIAEPSSLSLHVRSHAEHSGRGDWGRGTLGFWYLSPVRAERPKADPRPPSLHRIDEQEEASDRRDFRSPIDVPAAWTYECPVCGVELARSNFDTPAIDYYCPVCTTRQMPRRWGPAEPAPVRIAGTFVVGEERP